MLHKSVLGISCLGVIALAHTTCWAAEYTNFIGMKFRDVESGSFFMGSCAPLEGKAKYAKGDPRCPSGTNNDFDNHATNNSAEYPQHEVQIANFFQMGVHEVTYKQFWKYVLATQPERASKAPSPDRDNYPVRNVSWAGTKKFIAWLNENKPASDNGTYRLPTEAEWEYAARAGSTDKFPWGASMKKGMSNCNDRSACGESYADQLAPVGSFPPNRLGLHDMPGNVSEIVEDCWHDSFNGAPLDGGAWVEEGCPNRVVKGGSGQDDPYFQRSAMRGPVPIAERGSKMPFIGFRVVRDPR